MDISMVRKNVRVGILEQPMALFVNKQTLEASIVGITTNTTPRHITRPVIHIGGWKEPVKLAVSCVTHESPYKSHPFLLVNPDRCKYGVYTDYLLNRNENKYTLLSNVSVKILTEEYFADSLEVRQLIKLDPFQTNFNRSLTLEDWSKLRLCFHAYIKRPGNLLFDIPLTPIVSDPIFLMMIEPKSNKIKPVTPAIIRDLLAQKNLCPSSFSTTSSSFAPVIQQRRSLVQQFLSLSDNSVLLPRANPSTSESQKVTEKIPSFTNTRNPTKKGK